MFSWVEFLVTGAFVMPAMIRLLHAGPAAEPLSAWAMVVLLVAALVAKVMHDENESETAETLKERERRAERYTSFGKDRDDDR